jgi:hypothetical protein
MIWPWQRYRASDEIIACTCGSTLPALPQLPLANMVRRGTSIVRVNTGTMLQCIQCQQKYFVATVGPHKGLAVLRREPVATDPPMRDYEELAKRLKQQKAMPIFARDEMRPPP